MGRAAAAKLAPSCRAPYGHEQTRKNFHLFFTFFYRRSNFYFFSPQVTFRPAVAAGRHLAELRQKPPSEEALSQVGQKVSLRLPQVGNSEKNCIST